MEILQQHVLTNCAIMHLIEIIRSAIGNHAVVLAKNISIKYQLHVKSILVAILLTESISSGVRLSVTHGTWLRAGSQYDARTTQRKDIS